MQLLALIIVFEILHPHAHHHPPCIKMFKLFKIQLEISIKDKYLE